MLHLTFPDTPSTDGERSQPETTPSTPNPLAESLPEAITPDVTPFLKEVSVTTVEEEEEDMEVGLPEIFAEHGVDLAEFDAFLAQQEPLMAVA